jgi:hypothetical protein
MAITIHDDCTTLEINGEIISQGWRRPGGWREVTCWPRFHGRDQAITALTITELPEAGHGTDDPLVAALREELR